MANNLKIKKYWITTLCIVFCSLASFAQDLSDAETGFDVTKAAISLREHGIKDQDINREITLMRQIHTDNYLAIKKYENVNSNKTNAQTTKANTNRSLAEADIPQIEKDALLALYNSTEGTKWTSNQGWDFSTPVISQNHSNNGANPGWYGVEVTDGHVTRIYLNRNNLKGTIPLQIGQLSKLRSLDLGSNKLSGPIPHEIGQLVDIIYLQLGRNLELSGSIPKEIGLLTKAENIDLMNNNLEGAIPSEIGNLTSLKTLYLSYNKLSGNIPAEIGKLSNLQVLDFTINKLDGTIPEEIYNLTKLDRLQLTSNLLTGTISSNVGKLINLSSFNLSNNKFEGNVPNEITQLSKLAGIFINNNSFTGPIPNFNFTILKSFNAFNFHSNKFRFADFETQYNLYDSTFLYLTYAYQAAIDSEKTINGNIGNSVTLTMYEDERFSPNEVFQWYKGISPNGVLIAGATSRKFVIPNLDLSDAGDYYCVSTHPQITIPTNVNRNLILTRNPIHLNIVNCDPIAGTLKSTAEKFYTNAQSKFSFETTATGLTYEWSTATATGTPVNTLPSNTTSLYSYSFTEAGDYVVTLIVKDDNQCSTTFTKAIKVVDRYCAKEPVDFAFETTSTNLNYTWTSTDSSGNIVNTVTNTTGLYTFTPELPGDYVIELVANGASQCVSLFTKNITIDECVPFISCTKDNPLSPEMHRLFIALISKLATTPNGIDVNVYAHKEIAAMAPYTTEKTAMIYNFINTSSAISFSFTKTATESDVYLPKSATGSITAIDLSKYEDALTATTVATTYNNGVPNTKDGHVKNIDFCPKELSCVSHVALVIDESGSIDATEFNKIKKQLKSFVLQQAKTNDDIGSNIHVSITGMSDSDANTRTDFIAPLKMTAGNVGQFNNWIDQLGKRYGKTGISQASDYWKSGLDGALAYSMKPTFVIMVTDGAQTDNVAGLRATFKMFNNNNKAETEPKLPHLYVVGIENGFYIDRDSYTSKGIPRDQDPNYNPSLAPKDNLAARTTPFLTKSLQYLLDLTPTEWPLSDINQFTVGTYYGHDNFELLASDETYFSDKLADGKVVCGTAAIKDFCDDCFSFKPEPGKEYILSAWVKEESFIQVKNYENPIIKIVFYNNKEALDIPAQRIDSLVVKANGDIIDGWQRVVKKFKIPTATITMAIELENMSPSIPVYFDDIRIHPLQGSVKSFVYDPVTFKLMSELDENNYSTFYEYDNEGGLVRVKKETAKGIKTIQETRSGSVINITQ
ncbi:VWA domain-containing protein [Flavobacterium sp. CLA17]|uniref:leucine-rich repeat domain-containing protein n=1 Tax=Flavobacterium sp. CLA17 TaxID=2724135 RepID=UPI0014915902|nr:VWA domain-containing protein [Flavobacterium sp. CLA17]QSB27667.1 VWA domain-containing protein [Flavobacterium sp. CLA17]